MRDAASIEDTVAVFTGKTLDEILRTGGSRYWKLKPSHAGKMTYLVCARNSKKSQGKEPHGAGFLIGHISEVVPTPDEPGRFLILISKWARIDVPGLWTFGRAPVQYKRLADLGINPETIKFEALPERRQEPISARSPNDVSFLTIAEAKAALARTFGVNASDVEITIRG